jgi:hypothetical protein
MEVICVDRNAPLPIAVTVFGIFGIISNEDKDLVSPNAPAPILVIVKGIPEILVKLRELANTELLIEFVPLGHAK